MNFLTTRISIGTSWNQNQKKSYCLFQNRFNRWKKVTLYQTFIKEKNYEINKRKAPCSLENS